MLIFAKVALYLRHTYIIMKATNKMIKKWQLVKEYGYVQELSNMTGKSATTISRIVSGRQGTTPEVLIQIQKFLAAKEKVNKTLTLDHD